MIIIVGLLLALHMGSRALWDPDEGRYAEMGREVLILSDWVTPHLDYLLYFEKPMMFVWMEALSQKAFGVNETASRIPPLLCAFGTVFLVWLAASRQWGKRAGLISALVLTTAVEFFVLANSADINMALSFFVTAALTFFWIAHFENKPGYYYLAWISMGLATLTKGPVGFVLPAGIVFVYILATRQFRLILEARPLTGMLAFLLVTLPWYIMVCRRNPEFFNFFFVNQNLMRFATKIHHRHQPFWFFIPVIIGGFVPWTFLVPAVFKRLKHKWKTIPETVVFSLVWFAVAFLIFTPSQSKLATYILPCFPPLSMLIGYTFKDSEEKAGKGLYILAAIWSLIGLVMIILPFLSTTGLFDNIRHPENIRPVIEHGVYMGLVLLAGSIAGVMTGKKAGLIPGFGMIGLALLLTGLLFSGSWDSTQSTKAILENLPANARLCAYSKYYQSSTFYAKRPVYLVGEMDELTFGQTHRNNITIDEKSFPDLLMKDCNMYCLTREKNVEDILKKVPNARIISKEGQLVLINASNLPSDSVCHIKKKEGKII